jgi:histidine triad (HIT) family protein
MAVEGDCIFCKVLSGEIPSERVDEDEHTIAIMDIKPWTRGHALVIPKAHSKDLLEISDEDLARTAQAAKRLARRMTERLGCDGVNLINSCGAAAWQTIFHFHIHVIPRYEDDPLQLPTQPRDASRDDLAQVAGELRG